MAKKLRISEEELADNILNMTKEERFAGLKAFYLMAYPNSKEFYESFGRPKRINSDSSPEESFKKLKSEEKESSDEEDEPTKPQIDFYEDMSTFREVFDFIDFPENHTNEPKISNLEKKSPKPKSSTFEISRQELFESLDKVSTSEAETNETKSEHRDHYDDLLDELFS